jgi:hypothetical protein
VASVVGAAAIDCPDGLARCEGGGVWVSRIAVIPYPCNKPPPACECPWERVADCEGACVADGVEQVVDRQRARAQLCAPAPDAGPFVLRFGDATPAPACDEGARFSCADSNVVDCGHTRVVGRCLRGCAAESISAEDEGIDREAAFAILCSR